jgi:ATP-dependent DNA helicase RecG
VEYTLRKGFNDAECQKWIMKALNDHKVLSRKQINELLWNKLPVDFTEEQKMDKIKNLLYKMHKNDEIWLDEDRMWHRKES